jgi:hypothetical protein
MLKIVLISLSLVAVAFAGTPSYTTPPISTTPPVSTTPKPDCPNCMDVYYGKANFASCNNGSDRSDNSKPDPCNGNGEKVNYGFVIRNKGGPQEWGCCAGKVDLQPDGTPNKPNGWGSTGYKL